MSTAFVENSAKAPSVRISYGSIAFPLSPKAKANTDHTHRWTVFVRGADNQDITYAIAKVVFHLHETFGEPVRELTSPPFAVSETGWGVFDVAIDIVLKDPAAPQIRLVHPLKLYQDVPGAGAGSSAASTDPSRPVLSEHYEEIVFNQLPADSKARAAILQGPGRDPPPYPDQEHLTVWSDGADVVAIEAARAWVAERKDELQDRLTKGRAEEAMIKKQLEDMGYTY